MNQTQIQISLKSLPKGPIEKQVSIDFAKGLAPNRL